MRTPLIKLQYVNDVELGRGWGGGGGGVFSSEDFG